jgi:hypothetical protein
MGEYRVYSGDSIVETIEKQLQPHVPDQQFAGRM